MKTIVAFSDSHHAPLPDRLLSIAFENDYVFFLGDGITFLGDLLLHKQFHGVRGNCDYCAFEDEETLEIEGIRILLTHGDKYRVKNDLTALSLRASELGCNLVLYGHTHFAQIDEHRGVTFVNPGAIQNTRTGNASYAYVVINNGKITAKIVNL